eukprot:scaffold8864_cov122-Isochrysis_galbana.AAC.10
MELVYARDTVAQQLAAADAMAGASSVSLEELCPGWSQPARVRPGPPGLSRGLGCVGDCSFVGGPERAAARRTRIRCASARRSGALKRLSTARAIPPLTHAAKAPCQAYGHTRPPSH